jgi:hypothetical protein
MLELERPEGSFGRHALLILERQIRSLGVIGNNQKRRRCQGSLIGTSPRLQPCQVLDYLTSVLAGQHLAKPIRRDCFCGELLALIDHKRGVYSAHRSYHFSVGVSCHDSTSVSLRRLSSCKKWSSP